jgi:glutamine amidotransferase
MENLRSTGLVELLEEEVLGRGKPFLGVCLGMQLLARTSVEHGRHDGLGWIAADVLPLTITGPEIRVPHTGWNDIELRAAAADTPLARVRPAEAFYFNHSLHVVPDDESVIAAETRHGQRVVAAIARDNICATQFHPEKSQQAGLEVLVDFVHWRPPVGALAG